MPKGSRVLMADDDKMLIDMYKERLELAGYIVTLCRNGEEALSKLREAKPDIILLDIMMPKINGYEALASIKSDPSTKDIPVIMLSALMRDFNREKAVEAGADDYLIKSEAMPADVITKIEQVLAKYGKSAAVIPGAVPPIMSTPTAPPSPLAVTSTNPLPDLPPSPPSPSSAPESHEEKKEAEVKPEIVSTEKTEKLVEESVEKPEETSEKSETLAEIKPIASESKSDNIAPTPDSVASTPDSLVMQPDAPQNQVIFTPVGAEIKTEPNQNQPDDLVLEQKAETPNKSHEDVPVVKINSSLVAEPPLASPVSPNCPSVVPVTPPLAAIDSNQIEKKGQSLASIVWMVAIAMLLTTLINDLAIYFFFFANR